MSNIEHIESGHDEIMVEVNEENPEYWDVWVGSDDEENVECWGVLHVDEVNELAERDVTGVYHLANGAPWA